MLKTMRGGSLRGLLLLAVAAVLVLVTLSVTAPAADAQQTFDCSRDVMFVGAPGSGENPRQQGLLGPTVESSFTSLTANLRAVNRTVDKQVINYPALPVATLYNSSSGVADYLSGIQTGVDQTIELLRNYQANASCAHQNLVLAGYSQGGIVIHRVLRILEAPEWDGIRTRLRGVLLIADGDRVPSDTTLFAGNADKKSKGVGVEFGLVSGSSMAKLSTAWKGRVTSICVKGDPVCGVVKTSAELLIAGGGDIHVNAYAGSKILSDAVKKLTFNFSPQLSDGDVSGSLTGAVDKQLLANVRPDCAAVWALKKGAKLPVWATLTPSGRVQGTPTTVTQSLVPATITSKCSGERDLTTAVNISFSITTTPTSGYTVPMGKLQSPFGVAVDRAGTVYVADNNKSQILKLLAGATKPTAIAIPGKPFLIDVSSNERGDLIVVGRTDRGTIYKIAAGTTKAVAVKLVGDFSILNASIDANGEIAMVAGVGTTIGVNAYRLPAAGGTPTLIPLPGEYTATSASFDRQNRLMIATASTNGTTAKLWTVPVGSFAAVDSGLKQSTWRHSEDIAIDRDGSVLSVVAGAGGISMVSESTPAVVLPLTYTGVATKLAVLNSGELLVLTIGPGSEPQKVLKFPKSAYRN